MYLPYPWNEREADNHVGRCERSHYVGVSSALIARIQFFFFFRQRFLIILDAGSYRVPFQDENLLKNWSQDFGDRRYHCIDENATLIYHQSHAARSHAG